MDKKLLPEDTSASSNLTYFYLIDSIIYTNSKTYAQN